LQAPVTSHAGCAGNPMHPMPTEPAATGKELKLCLRNQ